MIVTRFRLYDCISINILALSPVIFYFCCAGYFQSLLWEAQQALSRERLIAGYFDQRSVLCVLP